MKEKEQMDELERYLIQKEIPYIRKDRYTAEEIEWQKKFWKDCPELMPDYWGEQIITFDDKGEKKWDVIYGYSAYATPDEPFEGMGDIFKDADCGVEGYLTAQDVINKIEKSMEDAK